MTENIFKNIADKKTRFKQYAKKAHEFQWIDTHEYDGIIKNLENDVLTIGVIGQMKCGKSTFLNALVYGDEVLPAATTPMTASLSVITYGEKKRLEAEFYTFNEWEELKHLANRSLNEVESDENQKSKIKAAKEIVEKSVRIESQIRNLLGTKKEDSFDRLIDYVGADGKYIAITKSVKIYMPLDYLKGVEIVDTPGFNDPIISRVERTKEFLTKADAVIMLLYAGRAFDSVDKDIIFNQLRTIGIGKLLIGVNKYDLCIENDSEIEIISNVKNQLLQASREFSNNSIAELAIETDPLLLSASMALMSKMKMDKISKDSGWNFYYKQASNVFGISSQKEMLEKSLFPVFEKALMDIIFKSKDEILLKKPKNFIDQKGENEREKLEDNLMKVKSNLTILNKPDNELEELLRNTKKAERKINRKISNIEIEETLNSGIKSLTRKTKDIIFDSKQKCLEVINDYGVVINSRNLYAELKRVTDRLEIDLDRLFENSNVGINSALNRVIGSFINDIEEIADDYLEDFYMQDYISTYKKVLSKDIVEIDFKDLLPSSEQEERVEGFLATILFGIGYLATWGGTTLNIAFGRAEARESVESFYSMFNLDRIKQEITTNGETIIKEVNKRFKDDFLSPIIQKTNETIENKANREKELLQAKNKLSELEKDKEKLEEEIRVVSSIL